MIFFELAFIIFSHCSEVSKTSLLAFRSLCLSSKSLPFLLFLSSSCSSQCPFHTLCSRSSFTLACFLVPNDCAGHLSLLFSSFLWWVFLPIWHWLGWFDGQGVTFFTSIFHRICLPLRWIPDCYLHGVTSQLPLFKEIPLGIPIIRIFLCFTSAFSSCFFLSIFSWSISFKVFTLQEFFSSLTWSSDTHCKNHHQHHSCCRPSDWGEAALSAGEVCPFPLGMTWGSHIRASRLSI